MFWCTRFKREKKNSLRFPYWIFRRVANWIEIGKMLQVALEERTGVFLLLHLLYFLFSLLSSLRKVPRLEKPKKKEGIEVQKKKKKILRYRSHWWRQPSLVSSVWQRLPFIPVAGHGRPLVQARGGGKQQLNLGFSSAAVCVSACVYIRFFIIPLLLPIFHPPPPPPSWEIFFLLLCFCFYSLRGGVGGVGVGDRSGCLERARAAKKRENFGMV